jgi:hypothetical protein
MLSACESHAWCVSGTIPALVWVQSWRRGVCMSPRPLQHAAASGMCVSVPVLVCVRCCCFRVLMPVYGWQWLTRILYPNSSKVVPPHDVAEHASRCASCSLPTDCEAVMMAGWLHHAVYVSMCTYPMMACITARVQHVDSLGTICLVCADC